MSINSQVNYLFIIQLNLLYFILNQQFQSMVLSYLRHGLVNSFNAVSHGELIDDLFGVLIEVYLPRVVPSCCREGHRAAIFFTKVVE